MSDEAIIVEKTGSIFSRKLFGQSSHGESNNETLGGATTIAKFQVLQITRPKTIKMP
jgi:hypothetical protein